MTNFRRLLHPFCIHTGTHPRVDEPVTCERCGRTFQPCKKCGWTHMGGYVIHSAEGRRSGRGGSDPEERRRIVEAIRNSQRRAS